MVMKTAKTKNESARLISVIKSGGIAVMPTDTIYGICGSAMNRRTVEKIYRLRRRDNKKPMIILIGAISDLEMFNIRPAASDRKHLARFWPGKVSVVFKTGLKKIAYLHRGTNSLAFRMPRPRALRALLAKTGPIVAPSANIQGREPAHSVRAAKKYFGDKVDFYFDKGIIKSPPSTLIMLREGKPLTLRKGAVTVR